MKGETSLPLDLDFRDIFDGREGQKKSIDAHALEASEGDVLTPVCQYKGGQLCVSAEGVFFITERASDLVCSELRILEETRNAKGHSWGKLLWWKDRDGKEHTWSMPMQLLGGDNSEVLRVLRDKGLTIAPEPRARERLIAYIEAASTSARAVCVDKLGWHNSVYVMADRVIGEVAGEKIVFQDAVIASQEQHASGTLEQWTENVASLAGGNSRAVFAISSAFAGPVLKLVDEESGGFHFCGASSSGKTTVARLATSVWGHPEKSLCGWRATANGLESIAAQHNDNFLALDEMSACESKQLGEAAYMLANGKGKARANRAGGAKESAAWTLIFLSTGEAGLRQLMEAAGKRSNAGQEVRIAEIPADAGKGLGIFETLNRVASAPELAIRMKEATLSYHGTAGEAFICNLVAERDGLVESLPGLLGQFVSSVVPAGASGQVERVARRFALVAVTGELTIRYGLTGWAEGESTAAASRCFTAWLEKFGTGNREDKAVVEEVVRRLQSDGQSRFQRLPGGDGDIVRDRLGFVRKRDGNLEFLVFPEQFKSDLIAGYYPRTAIKALESAGMIRRDNDGVHIQRNESLPGFKLSQRMYCIVLPETNDEA